MKMSWAESRLQALALMVSPSAIRWTNEVFGDPDDTV